MSDEQGYIILMKAILADGEDRAARNGKTKAVFGEKLVFDLTNGFPLLTTKRVFWRGVAEELFWFLRGSTNAKELSEKGVNIWNDNTSREFLDSVGLHHIEEGHLGAGYGHCWKAFNGDYPSGKNGVDQIRYVLEQLITNPQGRRAVLSAWNPSQLSMAALAPCHFVYEFYISETRGLSCMMVMRSCDVAAGLPFNIASTALLTTLIAKLLYIPTDKIVVITGDTHLYEEHIEGALIQIEREPKPKPTLEIVREAPPKDASLDKKVKWLETLQFEDVKITGYECHPAIKFRMIA